MASGKVRVDDARLAEMEKADRWRKRGDRPVNNPKKL